MNLPFREIGSGPFLPDNMVHLSHTPVWAELTQEERISCNRLVGLMVNDLFRVIETALIVPTLQGCLKTPGISPSVRKLVTVTIDDEYRHDHWFSTFNRQADSAPREYIKIPRPISQFLAFLLGNRYNWKMGLWAVFFAEEWSIAFSGLLGEQSGIDPAYQNLHSEHQKEERRHVRLDEKLSEYWTGTPAWYRSTNCWILGNVLRSLVIPNRGIRRVIHRLCVLHPRLQPRQEELVAKSIRVGQSEAYWKALVPVTRMSHYVAAWQYHGYGPLDILPGIRVGQTAGS